MTIGVHGVELPSESGLWAVPATGIAAAGVALIPLRRSADAAQGT
ncbi:hypothetical protein AB0I69_03905 [Streptomyces sp. NPDC050508]